MIDKKRIEDEAQHFFEWPDPKHRDTVTLTSCVIFAATIAEMVRAAERKHWRTLLSREHVFRGNCPDAENWHDRDPECPACRTLGDWRA